MAGAVAAVVGGGVALGAALEGPLGPGGPAASAAGLASPAIRAEMLRKMLPSVVLISTPGGSGSGLVLDQAGHILTAGDAVGNGNDLHVQAAGDASRRTAHLIGRYPHGDLAVVRADNPCGLQRADFGDSGEGHAGDVVLTVSTGPGLSGHVTEGIIYPVDRAVTDPATRNGDITILREAIYNSTPVSPGNRGGALLNASGQVIGIATLAASPDNGPQAEGVGAAVPASLARDIASKIIATDHATNVLRAALGTQTSLISGSAPNCESPM